MEIRLQLKTHYQISKPGIFSVLLLECTSPIKCSYPEVISKKLAGIDFETIALNKESAKFAVAMAQSFGFITQNMFWDWKGRAIVLILDITPRKKPAEYLKLTSEEEILYFKYYLEADGAAILEICKLFEKIGQISRKNLLSNDFIDQIFINIWGTYKLLTSDLRQKVYLKDNIQKLKSRPYTFKTRIHKALTHIESLVEFGFFDRIENKNEIIFVPRYKNGKLTIKRLINELETVEKMEKRFSKFEHFEIIKNIHCLDAKSFDPEIHSNLLWNEIIKTYKKAFTEPSKMASISILSDVISTKFLSSNKILIKKPDIENELISLKSKYPHDINFHVDKAGKKAYVVFSEKLCNSTYL